MCKECLQENYKSEDRFTVKPEEEKDQILIRVVDYIYAEKAPCNSGKNSVDDGVVQEP